MTGMQLGFKMNVYLIQTETGIFNAQSGRVTSISHDTIDLLLSNSMTASLCSKSMVLPDASERANHALASIDMPLKRLTMPVVLYFFTIRARGARPS